jgi:adenine phosphoribosyltransferase
MTLYIASTSAIKIQVCKEYMKYSHTEYKFVPCNVNVDNPEQPYGVRNTLECAMRRIVGVFENVNKKLEKYDEIIAIENGITTKQDYMDNYKVPSDDVCSIPDVFDFAVVVVFSNNYSDIGFLISQITSPKFLVPVDDVDLLRETMMTSHKNGGYTETYGSLMCVKYGVPSNNWMVKYDIDRIQQLSSLFEKNDIIPRGNQYLEQLFLNLMIKTTQDFPKKGIVFKDIFPLFISPISRSVIMRCIETRVTEYINSDYDWVAGPELRGTMLSQMISTHFNIPLLPVRKAGKLPPPVISQAFTKEYGEDAVEIPDGLLKPGERVLIIDDVMATGGTMKAVIDLIEKTGAVVRDIVVLNEVCELRETAIGKIGREWINILDV